MYDLENLCTDIETLLKANLNTKISAINTEKNDSTSLDTIDSSAYFFQSLDGKQINYDPVIIYGISGFDPSPDGAWGFTPIHVDIDIAVVKADNGEDLNISNRMLRYQRALREVIEDNFFNLDSKVKLSVQNQIPVNLALLNSSYTHKGIGITVKALMG